MYEFLQHCIYGLGIGSIYALIALGYTMVFGILKFINFAHSDIYMIGAFTGYYFSSFFKLHEKPGISSFLFALTGAVLVCSVLGFVIEKIAYKPLRNAPKVNILITAIGVSLFLEFGGQLLFGAGPKVFPTLLESSKPLMLGGLQFNFLQLMVLLISLLLMILLHFIVYRTQLGLAMRAVSFNSTHAVLMGISVDWVVSATFMIGSGLAGAAGVLVGMTYPAIDPLMGVLFGLKAFIAAVLGGIGNLFGAVVGALLMGLAETLVVAYLASSYRDALAFGILIVVLIFKPNGLFGKAQIEKV